MMNRILKDKTCMLNNSERPVDALALKKVNYWLSDNLKSRDASASKKVFKVYIF